MDENYRTIYRMLRTLERAMDAEEFDYTSIGAKALGISEPRWGHLIEMLIDEGYVKGIHLERDAGGNIVTSVAYPRITLKGLEYLSENTLMKQANKAAKGIADLIP